MRSLGMFKDTPWNFVGSKEPTVVPAYRQMLYVFDTPLVPSPSVEGTVKVALLASTFVPVAPKMVVVVVA